MVSATFRVFVNVYDNCHTCLQQVSSVFSSPEYNTNVLLQQAMQHCQQSDCCVLNANLQAAVNVLSTQNCNKLYRSDALVCKWGFKDCLEMQLDGMCRYPNVLVTRGQLVANVQGKRVPLQVAARSVTVKTNSGFVECILIAKPREPECVVTNENTSCRVALDDVLLKKSDAKLVVSAALSHRDKRLQTMAHFKHIAAKMHCSLIPHTHKFCVNDCYLQWTANIDSEKSLAIFYFK